MMPDSRAGDSGFRELGGDANQGEFIAERLAGWFTRARHPNGGYGGPVAHWWRDSLLDCRPGYDWRYEGIVAGYLALHRHTRDEHFLESARQAGDDLLATQSADGHWPRSRFELNPGTAGTPHEYACAIALLMLAERSRGQGSGDSNAVQKYVVAAKRSVEVSIARFWRDDEKLLADDAVGSGFVPNKAATFVDALVRLARVTGDSDWIEKYARPIGDGILSLQVRRNGHRLDGAIPQNRLGRQTVEKYFPYYVARCIQPLFALAEATADNRYSERALAAGQFVASTIESGEGSLPQVIYADGRVQRDPRWIAAVGDVLLALRACTERGLAFDCRETEAWLRRGVHIDGSVRTANGFGGQAGRAPGDVPELRDILPIVGWTDKAFRYFAEAGTRDRSSSAENWSTDCVFHGQRYRYESTARGVAAIGHSGVVWSWRYGDDWAVTTDPAFARK